MFEELSGEKLGRRLWGNFLEVRGAPASKEDADLLEAICIRTVRALEARGADSMFHMSQSFFKSQPVDMLDGVRLGLFRPEPGKAWTPWMARRPRLRFASLKEAFAAIVEIGAIHGIDPTAELAQACAEEAALEIACDMRRLSTPDVSMIVSLGLYLPPAPLADGPWNMMYALETACS